MPRGVYPRQPILERFWSKVNKDGPIPEYAPHLGNCWLWTASQFVNGYGKFWDGTRLVRAHRWAYEAECGAIPEGPVSDHLCRVRNCVRRSHIELVTCAENLRRGVGPDLCGQRQLDKTHCPRQHPYDEENTYVDRRGWRQCRTCHRERDRRRRAKQERVRESV